MTDDTGRAGLTDEQRYQSLKEMLGIEEKPGFSYSRQLSAGDAAYLRGGDQVVFRLEGLGAKFSHVAAALQRTPRIIANDTLYTVESVERVYKPGEAALLGADVTLQGVNLNRLESVIEGISRGIPIEAFAADGELEIALRSRGRDPFEGGVRRI